MRKKEAKVLLKKDEKIVRGRRVVLHISFKKFYTIKIIHKKTLDR